MNNKRVKDERILQMQRKIFAEAYFVTVFLLFISALAKAYVMNVDYTHYLSEIGILALSSIYVAVRSMVMGNHLIDTSKGKRVLYVLSTLGVGIIITVIAGMKNYAHYGEQYSGVMDLHFLAALAVTFLSSIALISAGLLFVYLCHKKGQKRIENKLREDDAE